MAASEDAIRARRGGYKPENLIETSPLFAWPIRPVAVIRWLYHYLFPWIAIYVVLSILTWKYLTPELATMRVFHAKWVGFALARNLILVVFVTSFWHIYLHVLRLQGTEFKYDSRWLARNNPLFLFKDQVWDNVFWTVASAVPIWTAYEVITFWAFANGYVSGIDWRTYPIYCGVLLLAIPLLHVLHFYFVHRLIHSRFLYRTVHYLHHKNANPGPWSGLAMHPIEHLLYFSGTLIYWVLPAHPLHVMFHLQLAALLPSQGHSGFARLVARGKPLIDAADYNHYLHHKFFECNYGSDWVPLDKWFGTFHDGSPEAEKAMMERFRARRGS